VSDDFDWGRDRLNPDGLSALELARTEPADTKEVLPPSALNDPSEIGPNATIVVYEVMAGDTLNEIAESFSIPMRSLAQMNRLRNPSHIMIGQRLRLPVSKEKETGVPVVQELAYRVSRGETLTQLADYFGASVKQLAADNHIKDATSLQEGQLIRVRVPAFKPGERDDEEEAEAPKASKKDSDAKRKSDVESRLEETDEMPPTGSDAFDDWEESEEE
jgi:LysM repeat protein